MTTLCLEEGHYDIMEIRVMTKCEKKYVSPDSMGLLRTFTPVGVVNRDYDMWPVISK